VCAAGKAAFAGLEDLTDAGFELSVSNKLMGQVNLVRLGLARVRDGGSFTLTSGVLAAEPTPGSAAISLVNAGVEAFARAAALEMPRGTRINVVSPPWVAETLQAMGRDPSRPDCPPRRSPPPTSKAWKAGATARCSTPGDSDEGRAGFSGNRGAGMPVCG